MELMSKIEMLEDEGVKTQLLCLLYIQNRVSGYSFPPFVSRCIQILTFSTVASFYTRIKKWSER